MAYCWSLSKSVGLAVKQYCLSLGRKEKKVEEKKAEKTKKKE